MDLNRLLLSTLLGAAVGGLGLRFKALTLAGSVVTASLGAVIYGFGGLGAALLVIFFFLSSSLLTQFGARRKAALHGQFEKGGRRDAWQVLANGSVGAFLMLLFGWGRSPLTLVGFVGAIGVATADTWATEIGVLSRTAPRSILNGRVVPSGTSGGVTLLGTSAAVLGSLAIGTGGYLLTGDWRLILAGTVGGITGTMMDSLLGASWQAMYSCPVCKVETERHPTHNCGAPSAYLRGWRWLNNDGVNFLATLLGAGVSIGVALLWR